MNRKMKKSLLALATVLVFLMTFLPVIPAIADGEFTAKLGAFMDDRFNADIGAWPDLVPLGGEIGFNIGEEAVITVDFGEPVKFFGAYAAIETDVPFPGHVGAIRSLKLDGVEIPMGAAYICDEGLLKGSTLRLTIRNEWNPDIPEQPIELQPLDPFTVLEVAFVVTEGELTDIPPSPPPPAGNEIPGFDPMGTYNAFLSLQTNESWMFRDAWGDASNGANGTWPGTDGVNYFDRLFVSNWGEPTDGVFTNAVLAGNGTYRVSLTGYGSDFNIITTDGNEMIADRFNLLYVSTDIPYNDDIEFINMRVIIGGTEVNQFRTDRGQYPHVTGETGYLQVYAIHIWESDTDFSYNMPTDGGEIALEFTVTGFDYDKAVTEPDPAPEETPEATPEETPGGTTGETPGGDGDGLGFWLWVIVGGGAVVIGAVILVVVKGRKK